ncbi:MAG: hypothetical protein ABIO82_02075 [Ginsengibacter sp.]
MKNIVLFVLFIIALVLFQFTSAQSVDDVIKQYIKERGGIDKINAIQSIYFEGTREMMGSALMIKVTKVENKLLRTDFEFGGSPGYTIITPDKGWTLLSSQSDKPSELPSNVFKAMRNQLDIAGHLVNYKAKGYTAELKGKENINGKEAYTVVLTNMEGIESTYFIDTNSKLLLQSRQVIEGGKDSATQPPELKTNYSDYVEVNGVKFPQTAFTEGGGMGESTLRFTKIEANISVDEKLYHP